MDTLKSHFIKAFDIDRSHFQLIRDIFVNGRINIIDHGSYKGHKRLEYDHVTIQITNPETRPLSPQLPQGIPSVTDEKSIEEYFVKYLMSNIKEKDEDYTYGSFIVKQIDEVIAMFKIHGFGTNQAIITIGNENSVKLDDPPCLRSIDCRIINDKLHFILYWRSWSLWSALCENLGGIQLLKEYMALELNISPGETIANSKGLHLYDFEWPIALARLNGIVPENSILTKKEIELGEKWLNIS